MQPNKFINTHNQVQINKTQNKYQNSVQNQSKFKYIDYQYKANASTQNFTYFTGNNRQLGSNYVTYRPPNQVVDIQEVNKSNSRLKSNLPIIYNSSNQGPHKSSTSQTNIQLTSSLQTSQPQSYNPQPQSQNPQLLTVPQTFKSYLTVPQTSVSQQSQNQTSTAKPAISTAKPVVSTTKHAVSTVQPLISQGSTFRAQGQAKNSRIQYLQLNNQAGVIYQHIPISDPIVRPLQQSSVISGSKVMYLNRHQPNTLSNSTQGRSTLPRAIYSTGQFGPPKVYTTSASQINTKQIEDMIPRVHYDDCRTKCQEWQAKYSELYTKYMRLAQNKQSCEASSSLQQQNYRLKQQLARLQVKKRNASDGMSRYIGDIIEKYRKSTLQQVGLLVDRYRLECRQNERY